MEFTKAPEMKMDSSHLIIITGGKYSKVIPCRLGAHVTKFENDTVIEFNGDGYTVRLVLTPADSLKLIQQLATGLL